MGDRIELEKVFGAMVDKGILAEVLASQLSKYEAMDILLSFSSSASGSRLAPAPLSKGMQKHGDLHMRSS